MKLSPETLTLLVISVLLTVLAVLAILLDWGDWWVPFTIWGGVTSAGAGWCLGMDMSR